MANIEKHNSPIPLSQAVETIKTAILHGQYEAAKGVTRIQLAVYFGIGKYVSQHTREGVWGTGALESISEQLRRELPGLRGYSATALKNMRKFYESWILLDSNSTSVLAESINTENQETTNSASALADSMSATTDDYQAIDIYHTIQVPLNKDFPIEDFFRVPFTHHIRVIEGAKELEERYYYIHRIAEEHLSEKAAIKLMKDDAYGHREQMPSNFRKTIPNAEYNAAKKGGYEFKIVTGENTYVSPNIPADVEIIRRADLGVN